MIRKIEMVQELRIRVLSPSWYYSEMGGGFHIPERLYFDELYKNQEQEEKLLLLAQQKHNKNSLDKEPQVETYWKTIEKNIVEK